MEKWIEVGRVAKPHGLHGDVKIRFEERFLEDIARADALFLPLKGQYLPYFIEEIRETPSGFLLKFEDVDSLEDAQPFAGKPLLLREEDLLPQEQESIDGLSFEEIHPELFAGYQLSDVHLGLIGTISDVVTSTGQPLAIVGWQGKDYFIPLVSAFVKQLDISTKSLLLELPEGMLEA